MVIQESPWINVKDRLPSNSEDVLCWYKYYRYGSYNRMYYTYGIGHYLAACDTWGGDVSVGTKSEVLFWMPLPKPQKEK